MCTWVVSVRVDFTMTTASINISILSRISTEDEVLFSWSQGMEMLLALYSQSFYHA